MARREVLARVGAAVLAGLCCGSVGLWLGTRVASSRVHPSSAFSSGVRHCWPNDVAKMAFAVALVTGVVGQIAVSTAAQTSFEATASARVAAVLALAAIWSAVGFLLATACQGLLSTSRGRTVAWLFNAIVHGAIQALALLGYLTRVFSGGYVTLGALEFTLSSSQHFGHALEGRYFGWTIKILAIALIAFVGWGLWLRRSMTRHGSGVRARRDHIALALAALAFCWGAFTSRGNNHWVRQAFSAEPVLAFISSVDGRQRFELGRALNPSGVGEPMAPPGPPLARGGDWKAALAKKRGTYPNVLLIMLESVSYRHLGYAGYDRPTTPNLDALHTKSLSFERAWSTATHSNYAQMAVLSSLFPRRRHGLDQYGRIDYPRVLLHDVMDLLGARTGTISSQDENWQGMRKFQMTPTPTYFWHSSSFKGEHFDSGTEKVVPDHLTVEHLLDWIKTAPIPQGSWSAYINLQGTHFPYMIPEDDPRPFRPYEPTRESFNYFNYPIAEVPIVKNRYDNALRYVDEQVGRLLAGLKARGVLDDTIILVTSDHGEGFYEHGLSTHGRTVFDNEARVPLMISWPQKLRPQSVDTAVSTLDLMPTLLDLLELPPHPNFQGESLLIARDGAQRKAVMVNIQSSHHADAVICWPYKLILERTDDMQYLFRLDSDPDERNNLVGSLPAVTKALTYTLNAQIVAQMDYHQEGNPILKERYQPRMRKCPDLPK